MRHPKFLVRLRPVAVAVLAIGAGLFTFRSARAECGDYVIVRNPLVTYGQVVASQFHQYSATDFSLPPPAGRDHRRPCTGPTCSSRDPAPSAPTPSILPWSDSQWAYLPLDCAFSNCQGILWNQVSCHIIQAPFPFPIEHPPRAA